MLLRTIIQGIYWRILRTFSNLSILEILRILRRLRILRIVKRPAGHKLQSGALMGIRGTRFRNMA